MADPLEIVITAKDDTGRVLESVQSKFTAFDQDLHRLERTGGQAFDGLGGAVQRLAVSFTRTLDPALGATVSRFSTLGANLARTAGAAGGLATVMGTTVVTAVAVAGLGLNQYIGTLSKLSQEQGRTNALLDAMDFGGLTGRAQGLDRQMRDLQATFSIWQSVKNVTVGALNEIGGALDKVLGGAPSGFVRRFGTDQAAIDIARQARAGTNAAIAQLVPSERARIRTESGVLGFQTSGDFAGLRAQAALGQRDIGGFLAEMDRREQALSNELSTRERLIVEEGDKLLKAAGSREAGPAEIGLIQEQIQTRREALGVTNAFEVLRRQRAEGAVAIGLANAAGEEDISRVPEIKGTEADAALAERRRAAELGQLDIARQRAEILGEITPELNAQLIVMERNLLLTQAGLTEDEKKLINARAQLALLEQQARLDPLAGLTRGFSEAANASREWGTELLQVARETDRNMSRTFSDGLFNLFTGKKGQDIGKQFAESLLRSLTDVVGRQLSGAVSGVFASALQGFRGVVPGAVGGGGAGFDLLSLLGAGGGGGPILSPTGQAAGTLVMTANGIGQVTPSGAVQLVQGGASVDPTQVVGVFTGANTLSGNVGGPTLSLAGAGGSYLAAVSATPISAIATYGFSTAVAQTQAGLALGFGQAAGGTTFAVTGATAGAPLTSTGLSAGSTVGTTAGVTVGGAATGVLAAVALGFTIYSGLSQPATAQNIAINAVSGAISGAILGAVIGAAFGGPIGALVGGVIGAVVGGAAAGGTTGLKAGGGKLSVSDRSKRVGEAAAGNLSAAIDQASSIEDLVAIVNTRWAPHGELQIRITYQGVTYWAGDFDDPPGALATVELMIIPEFLDGLVIQAGETGAPQHRQDLIDKFRAKRDELLGILSQIPVGFIEHDPLARVTRRTTVPFTRAIYGQAAGPRGQLVYSSEVFRRDLSGDDDTVAFLIARINEVGNKRALDVTRRDFLFGLWV